MNPDDIKILSDNEHVLQRPEMYIGSVVPIKKKTWIYNDKKIEEREIEYIPAILKLFDEVITNSIDEAIKTNFKFANKIYIKFQEDGTIEIYDTGRGLPIEFDEKEREYKSALAFLRLKAGSNFENDSERVSIGKFGVGVSLTNIFSKDFQVRTHNTQNKSMYLHSSNNNSLHKVQVRSNKKGKNHYTQIKYRLDFKYFGFEEEKYDEMHLGLLRKRVYDLQMIYPEIKFVMNGNSVRSRSFKEYISMIDDDHIIHENGYKLAVLPSEEFKHMSFINGIETYGGGTHVNLISDYISYELREMINKKYKLQIKPADIKNKLLFIISARNIIGTKFDSQTKERLVNSVSEISKFFNNIDKSFYKNLFNSKTIIEPIIDTYMLKKKLKEKREISYKSSKLLKQKIAKLIDAKNKDRSKCILFITEGDSATGSLIQVRDQKNHAVLPLRGKVMNVSNYKEKDIIKNKELSEIMAAIGLVFNEKPEGLRYSKIVILTDQDVDGYSINALLLNFFYKYWPELFEMNMIYKYNSPIVIAKKGKDIKRYYNLDDYKNENKENLKGYSISYNKGLGGLSIEEYDRMINKPNSYSFETSDVSKSILDMAFGSDTNKRKEWLIGD